MNDPIHRKRKADFGSLIEKIEKRSKKEATLESIEELIKLHKEYIKSGLSSAEIEIGLLSLIAEQVQEKEGLLFQFAKDSQRFMLALTEHISNLKAADKPDAQITLEQYKESKLHQSLTDGIHHYYGKLYIAYHNNTQDSQQKANELLVSENKLIEINKYLTMLQDISSLHKASSYIELALSESGRSAEEDTLVIKKTLQVIGECLKDINLSSETSEALSNTGIPVRDLAHLRNAMSHSSALFTLSEMGEDDKKGLMEGFKSIKTIIGKNISKIEREFVKDLANEAKNAYKGEDEAIKGKLEEIANATDFDEISQLTKEISEIVGSDHDNKKVKALLYDIRANIVKTKTESSLTLELDSIFRVPENPGVDKLFGEITRKRVPIDELYEKLYTELLEDLCLQDVNKSSDLHKKLEEAQNGIRARYTLISVFKGEFDLSEKLFEDCLNKMRDTHSGMRSSSIEKLEKYVQAKEPSENELIKLLKRDSYFKFMTQSANIDKVLQGTFSKLLSRLKIEGLDRDRIKLELEKIPYQDIEILNKGERLDFVLSRLKERLNDELYKKVYDAFYEKNGIVEGYKNRVKLINSFASQDRLIASEEYELLVKSLRMSEKETENLLSYSTHWRNAQCTILVEKAQMTLLEQLYRSIIVEELQQIVGYTPQQVKNFIKSLNLSANTSSIEQEITNKIQKYYLDDLKEKLKLLKDLSGNSKIEQQAVIEYLLLNIYNIIVERLDPSMKSQLKSARNYLAHGGSLIDILYHDIHERIASQAKIITESIDFEQSDDDFLMNVTDSLSKNPLLPKKGEWLGTSFLLDQVLQDAIRDVVRRDSRKFNELCHFESPKDALEKLCELSKLLEETDQGVIKALIEEKHIDLKHVRLQLISLFDKESIASVNECIEHYLYILDLLLQDKCISSKEGLLPSEDCSNTLVPQLRISQRSKA